VRPPLMFQVLGEIATKGSTRAFPFRRRNGRLGVKVTAASPETRSSQHRVAWAAQDALQKQGLGMFTGPVGVSLYVYLPRPASVTKTKRPLPMVKPDLDKLCRLVLDALARVVFPDDGAVCSLVACKFYAVHGDPPHIKVTVMEEVAPA
jgi:Holliday junction resolvase RusA-like endonuclease